MIVDTSALMAILLLEPDADRFAAAMVNATSLSMSAGSWIETTAVLVRRFPQLSSVEPERSAMKIGIEIVPVTVQQAKIAGAAYRRFGRGTGHPANLNFGDCFAYALSRATGEPLLFKGDDFAQTDVVAAL